MCFHELLVNRFKPWNCSQNYKCLDLDSNWSPLKCWRKVWEDNTQPKFDVIYSKFIHVLMPFLPARTTASRKLGSWDWKKIKYERYRSKRTEMWSLDLPITKQECHSISMFGQSLTSDLLHITSAAEARVAENRVNNWNFVNTVINLLFSLMAGNFLTSRATIIFSWSILLCSGELVTN